MHFYRDIQIPETLCSITNQCNKWSASFPIWLPVQGSRFGSARHERGFSVSVSWLSTARGRATVYSVALHLFVTYYDIYPIQLQGAVRRGGRGARQTVTWVPGGGGSHLLFGRDQSDEGGVPG